jgi:hypothetical protein
LKFARIHRQAKQKKKKSKKAEIEETSTTGPAPPKQEEEQSSCLAQSSLLPTPQGLVMAGSLQIGDLLVEEI